MNSLVVLFSVMVLASAKPSIPAIIGYAAPAVALAPAAVSHQSRIDVKSTPALVKTDFIAPSISPVVAAPLAYSAPLASPLAYGAQLAYGAPLAYTSPIAYSQVAAAYPSIYTPAIAPAIPALLKTAPIEAEMKSDNPSDDALPVAPTETPEVAAARAAHLEAKAFEEARHEIQKRSVVVSSPVVTPYAAYASPVVYQTPTVTRIAPALPHSYLAGAYSVHPY